MKGPKKPKRRAGPVARLPLPGKPPQRHRDARADPRKRVKERLRRLEED
jgi:hypothetical protein